MYPIVVGVEKGIMACSCATSCNNGAGGWHEQQDVWQCICFDLVSEVALVAKVHHKTPAFCYPQLQPEGHLWKHHSFDKP